MRVGGGELREVGGVAGIDEVGLSSGPWALALWAVGPNFITSTLFNRWLKKSKEEYTLCRCF